MIQVIVECSALIVLLIVFRELFRNHISANIMYGFWLVVVIRMIPFELLLGKEHQSLVLSLLEKISSGKFVRLDLAAVSIPWYLIVIWICGSAGILLWSFYVDFRFERMLFENRVRLDEIESPYPVYRVEQLPSSCVFKVKGKAGIYMGKEQDKPATFKTILAHEICHLQSHDLLWAKLRMIAIAVCWFNPLVWIGAVLSKADCEMACDERTIVALHMSKADYGKMLLDMVKVKRVELGREFFCSATMMSPTAHGLRVRLKKIVAKTRKHWIQGMAGVLLAVLSILTCFAGGTYLEGMSAEETIRQYVYYSNQNYQDGMKQLSIYKNWDYLFPPSICGDIEQIEKCENQAESKQYYQQETYQVKMTKPDGAISQMIQVVKVKEGDDWKVVMW